MRLYDGGPTTVNGESWTVNTKNCAHIFYEMHMAQCTIAQCVLLIWQRNNKIEIIPIRFPIGGVTHTENPFTYLCFVKSELNRFAYFPTEEVQAEE